MNQALCSVLGGVYHDLHFTGMKFRASRNSGKVASHQLLQQGFKSSPKEPKGHGLEARPRRYTAPRNAFNRAQVATL